ncbi:MAG TPA: UDP-3-O-(3-hydroxymyristoyl)glucosamine N-acyltransferase [Blastocatellia bacterium]|nr:UDP-3-O-(3-hydroxymyristoyl)glucosamine N-acyltransferase [Blastocatellia bacterium]
MRLNEIAETLECRLEGDAGIEIRGVATLENAEGTDISFLANTKYVSEAKRTRAAALIVGSECPDLGLSLLRHSNPYLAFAKAVEMFHAIPLPVARIHPTAWVSDTAKIGADVSIGAFSYVGEGVVIGNRARIATSCTIERNARIGEETVIQPGAVVCHDVEIGNRCIVQANAVIGSDGFGYAKTEDGRWYKILQAGSVTLEDEVEVGACTTIDRSTLGETRIGAGSKLDNLVQVGHGSTIGKHTLLCAQVGLAGSTKIGDAVVLAGQVGSAGHLSVGDGAIVTAQSGIGDDVEPGRVVSGSPAFANKKWLRATALFTRLPDLHRTLREMERRVATLEGIVQQSLDGKGATG